jgi:biotin carboxyl carrier protein
VRTYLIDDEKNEKVIDLRRTVVHSSELVEFHFSTLDENKIVNSQTVFIKKLAGQYFVSLDQVHWNKLARQDLPTQVLNVNKVYKIFRGYKPSGMGGVSEGELLTQMPGKVVKILVKKGDKVSKGATVLVLEAMKMENEIKAPMDGTIKQVHVAEGQALENGVLMIELEKE